MLKYNDTTQNYELFDIVINATGSKTHLSQLDEDDQLILNLENRQIVQRHPMWHSNYPETNQVISLDMEP